MYLGVLPYKTKQFFFLIIKLSIVAGASYFIYNKLLNNSNLEFNVFIDFLIKNHVFSSKNVIILLFLTILNWFFEILKWQHLVSFIKKISFSESAKQSLAAHTASLFTPNRIGDYGAKTVYYAKKFRKRILLLNLLGNITQMSVTLILGITGFIIFVNKYDVDISFYKASRFLIMIVIVGGFAVFGITQKKHKIKGFSIDSIQTFLKQVKISKHVITFLISLVRYAIFSFQFYFLLQIFGVNVSYYNAMIVITSMYLLSSIIPTIFIFDVIVKGSIALYLFDIVRVNELTILSITTLMWILNFVLPSLFGSFYVLNFNYYKSVSETE
jgi:hypothetical protein